MENVFSYLKWRGDLEFSASSFNAVDSLILSLIAYADFEGIVPGHESNELVTLEKVAQSYSMLHKNVDTSNKNPLFLDRAPILLKEAAATDRFTNIRVGKFVNRIDTKKVEQFSATTFMLSDGTVYIAFKGTDDSLIGWKEDFTMSYAPAIPAQTEAVEYLERIFMPRFRKIRMGGHSKGGNLAIYAAVHCRKQIRDRIIAVDDFDGPGFTKDILESEAFNQILPRITHYVPQASLIGLLLENKGERKIIKSSQTGLWQHDAFTWEVDAHGFPQAGELDKSSILLDGIIKDWINKLDAEQRESFVNALFGVLENIGIEKITDFSKLSNERIRTFIRSLNSLPLESREILTRAVRLFLSESRNAVKKQLRENFRLFGRKVNEHGKVKPTNG